MSHRFPARRAAAPPLDWALLVAGAVARQATSPTAAAQARLAAPDAVAGRFAPVDGRFSAAAADTLENWKAGREE